MKFRQSFWQKANLKFVFAISTMSILITTGCVPKDVPIGDTSSGSVQYSGFDGIVAAETVNGSRVTIRWNPSSDAGVVAYNIYDSTFKFQPKLIRTVSAPADRVTLSGLANQSLYSFRVRAANADNVEDGNIRDMKAIPYAGISNVQVVSSTSGRVNFADGTNADQINVYCKLSSATDFESYATVRNTALTSVLIEDLLPGQEYTCRAALEIDGFVDNNPTTVTFTPMGQASTLAFTTQPGNAAAGSPLSTQPVITIRDSNGNVVAGGPDSNALITLSIATSSPTTGTIRGTYTIEAVNGVATFPDIFLQEAGQKIITASKADTSSVSFGTGVLTVNSNLFTITPGTVSPDTSTIAISPAPPAPAKVANGIESYTVTITLRDAFGNAVSGVRPTIGSNIAGDTITQPPQNTNSSGEATGSISTTIADFAPTLRNLTIASPSGLSSLTVPTLFVPGPATRLAYTTQPVNSPAGEMTMNSISVEVQDAQGNRIRSGTASTSDISLSIANNINGAILTGTNPKAASDGTVTFVDLGIDRTGTGYKLIASSGALTPAYSNSFNVTAGTPKRISINGPPNVLSGACSTAITVQLQDLGGNPANAIQSTPINLAGFGTGSFYTSNTCGGAAVGSSLTFTAGTNTRTIYYKGNKAEALTILASDTSAVMTTGTLNMTVSPNKIGMIAQAASPPAAPGTPLSVVAGQCSTEIVITPMGNDNNPGPTFIPTVVSISGLLGSQAQLYSDNTCTLLLNAASITLPINSGPDYTYKLYLKDPKAESLMLSVADPDAHLTTTTGPQSVTILPSNLYFTGPTSVVSGACSSAFTIQMRDTQGTPAAAQDNRVLNINGIPGSSAGRFFTSAACSGGGSRTTLTFPQGNTSMQVYFKSVPSDSLSIYISDSLGQMANSQTINLTVSPSALRIVKPVAGHAATNICAGPFYIDTLDGSGSLTNAVNAITANLGGAGASTYYYSDSVCANKITSVTFSTGQNRKSVYVLGYYPETSLSLTATDAAAVLTQGTETWTVDAAKGWIGTAATDVDGSNNFLWFRATAKPVAARADGIYSATSMAMSPDNRYLYIVDYDRHRLAKYDYLNHTYVGWLGRYASYGGQPIYGSSLATPSNAACVATANGAQTPGWCLGGVSQAGGSEAALGGLYYPRDVVDDGTYVYVANYSSHTITRYLSSTGAFDGYLGVISGTSGLTAATGGPVSCSSALSGDVTPGWCRGGTADTTGGGNPVAVTGRISAPLALAVDDDYLYVVNRQFVSRYDKASGAFAGWIGMVEATPTGGAPGCTTTLQNQVTPGWCYGGQAKEADPRTAGQVGGFNYPRDILLVNNDMYIIHTNYNGVIVKYNKTTGASLGILPDHSQNWIGPVQMAYDGTNFFIADNKRVIKTSTTGLLEGWIGKVSSNAGMSGLGCTSLAVNDDTPGWCLGGSSRPGMQNQSFRDLFSIVYDGNGKIIVGQGAASGQVRRFDATTGAYEGTLGLESISPSKWTNNSVMTTARHGFDDNSMYNPQASHVNGDYLYVAEMNSSRVKKINLRTGELVGWIGSITSSPTGGMAGCTGSNSYTASPSWCLGANFQPSTLWGVTGMVSTVTNGIMLNPAGIASDSTYIYVTDRGLHRISRFRMDNGAPAGWIGKISTSPTGGDPGCNGAPAGTFTPGWCSGGVSTYGTGNGELYNPYGIVQHAGNLYVTDGSNHRVVAYNASSGAFIGWIGRTNAAPTGGCTVASNGSYNVSTSGWCTGGTAQAASTSDRGGGFYFWSRSGLTTDGTYLYIANFYNGRIDKYNFNGQYQGSARTRQDIYTDNWSNVPTVVNTYGSASCSRPNSLWTDGTNIYSVIYSPCSRANDTFAVVKTGLSSGQTIGWQAGIDPNYLPNDGDPGCPGATDSTPGWCRGGRVSYGLTLGSFSGMEGDVSGDANYVYISDEVGNRVSRFPK